MRLPAIGDPLFSAHRRRCHEDGKLITEDSPLASNDTGRLAAGTLRREAGLDFARAAGASHRPAGTAEMVARHLQGRTRMKKLIGISRDADAHWVGNGFPVRTIFSYQTLGQCISPFIMLDYAGPAEFPPSDRHRGVGEHPHRGFETVTIVYQGELEHRDSAGNHGKIGPGDVQWMTAASGVLHEEWHEQAFTRRGGVLEMIQLWVNLPAEHKMSPPKYQEILAEQIPTVPLGGGNSARVIAGEYRGTKGPASTFTPITLLDVKLKAATHQPIAFPDGFTTLVLVLNGKVAVNGGETAGEAEMAILDRAGDSFTLDAAEDTSLVVLGGQPIDEPVVSYGPFVMNTEAEIRQAVQDYRSGRMGRVK